MTVIYLVFLFQWDTGSYLRSEIGRNIEEVCAIARLRSSDNRIALYEGRIGPGESVTFRKFRCLTKPPQQVEYEDEKIWSGKP